jgi:hypothetical protein
VPFASIKSGLAALTTIPQQELWETVAFIGLMEWGFSRVKEPLEEYFDGEMTTKWKVCM